MAPVTPRVFGYGSLVNRATHAYPRAEPAELSGWRRCWRGTTLRPAAFLSVHPAPGARIAGLVAEVPGGDWAALDAREFGYARRDVTGAVAVPGDGPVAVYEVTAPPAEGPCPILLSYLDVVVQGFLREHGPDGVRAFFDTTDGWEMGIRDDRTAPFYPRAQRLSAEDLRLVDRELARVI